MATSAKQGLDRRNFSRLGLLAILVATILFAFTPIYVRLAETGPTATAFWRMILAVPLLWPILRMQMRGASTPKVPPRTYDTAMLILSGVTFGICVIFWQISVWHTSVANASLLASTHPVIVIIGAWVIFKERITPLFIGGAVLTFIGIFLLVRAGTTEFGTVAKGDMFALISATIYGVWMLILKDLRNRFTSTKVTIWTLGVAGLTALPVAPALGELFFPTALYGWLIIALFTLTNVVGHAIFNYGAGHLPASFYSVAILLTPVGSVVLGWAILSESVSWLQAAAAGCVIGGIVLAQRTQESKG